jgi:tetratricopeptide (TPR) repeat protein/cellulose biosynthesis protein BcsQ
MTEETAPGDVITFYSYKGGVGRTMALANVACLLALRRPSGKGVLMVDWDLEAPGLHRFFHNRITAGGRPLTEDEVMLRPGLIELFRRLDVAVREAGGDGGAVQTQKQAEELVRSVEPERYILETKIPALYLLKAGSFDPGYGANVNTFHWERLYRRSPFLFGAFAAHLAANFDYVLIDSRTGVTDTSGICTTLLPEKLVAVFTPNRQSLLGLEDPIKEITKHRRRSDDLRPLIIFPLPSRIELSELRLREDWRHSRGEDVPGYQPFFQSLFSEVYGLRDTYGLPHCDLGGYFDKVLIQHLPHFSYGEEVSALIEEGDRLSLTESYRNFLDRMLNCDVPWEQEGAASGPSPSAELSGQAERAFQALPLERQESAKRVLTRLVQLPAPGEQRDNARLRVKLDEFDGDGQELVRELTRSGTLRVSREGDKELAELADDSLVLNWRRLKEWVKEDRKFLLWRQSLRAEMARRAEAGGEGALLSGGALAEAARMLRERPDDLNGAEKEFIYQGVSVSNRRRSNVLLAAALALLVATVLAFVGYSLWSARRRSANEQQAVSRYQDGVRADAVDTDSAVAFYTQAVELKPDFADAYRNRGLAYAKQGKFDRALEDYNKALELRPDYHDDLRPRLAEAYTGLGTSLRNEKRYAEALEAYESALGLAPDFDQQAYIYYNRGLTYAAQGDGDHALADYNKAIELKPDFAEAYYIRATSLADKGASARAMEEYNSVTDDYSKAIESRPDFAAAYLNRGIFYNVMQNYDAAAADFNQVIRLGQQSPTEYDSLGLKEPDVYNLLGLTYSKKGDAARAIEAFGEAIKRRDDFIDAYYNRATAYFDAGLREQAKSDLTKVLALSNDPDVQQKAQRLLDRLTSPTSPSDATVTIHFVEADVDDVTSIKEQLAKRGISVQLVSQPDSDLASADVRYFHKEDKANAQYVNGVIRSALSPLHVPVNSGPVLLAKYTRVRNVDYGVIEVWLPSISDLTSPPR